jgi:DNA adenine methylase
MGNPFTKICGGKRQLIPELSARVPSEFGTYHEKFVGGGALFFWLQAQGRITKAILTDTNSRLIRTYLAVRDDVEAVIVGVQKMKTDRDSYYVTRAQVPDDGTDVDVACWFVYINRACFNGLYRENKQGKCNSPYGTPKSRLIDPLAFRASSLALQGVDIRCEDFAATEPSAGDFVYLDPPYWPKNKTTAKFTNYTAKGFGPEDQTRLRDYAAELRKKGVNVLLSNSDTDETRSLYDGFDVATVGARRAINSRVERRGKVSELLIR